MRYLFAVIDHEGNHGTDSEMEQIDVFNAGLEAEGRLLMAVGIAGPSTATLIDNRGGVGHVTSESIYGTGEFMSGFWILEADSHDHAIALATEGSRACNRKVEVRQLLGG